MSVPLPLLSNVSVVILIDVFVFVQAAKIDASDICLWFEIGQTSLQLDRFLIAKLAFEQSLRLDPAYWPSLDNFIVLVYALGNHTRKYAF